MLEWLITADSVSAFPSQDVHAGGAWQAAVEIGRLTNAALALAAILWITACCWRVNLTLGERFHWQAVGALATTALVGSIESYIQNVTGGVRTAFLTVSLCFLLVSIYHFWKSDYRRSKKRTADS